MVCDNTDKQGIKPGSEDHPYGEDDSCCRRPVGDGSQPRYGCHADGKEEKRKGGLQKQGGENEGKRWGQGKTDRAQARGKQGKSENPPVTITICQEPAENGNEDPPYPRDS